MFCWNVATHVANRDGPLRDERQLNHDEAVIDKWATSQLAHRARSHLALTALTPITLAAQLPVKSPTALHQGRPGRPQHVRGPLAPRTARRVLRQQLHPAGRDGRGLLLLLAGLGPRGGARRGARRGARGRRLRRLRGGLLRAAAALFAMSCCFIMLWFVCICCLLFVCVVFV